MGKGRGVTRRLQIAARALFGPLLFLTLADALLHLALATEGVQQLLRPRVEAALGRELESEVQIGKITLSPFLYHLELHQVAVRGPERAPLFQIDRVRLYPNLRRLLGLRLTVKTMVLLRPVIDLPDEVGPREGRPEVLSKIQGLLALPVDRLQIREGRLTLRREGRIWNAEGLSVDLWREEAQIRGELRVAGGVLHLAGQPLTWGNLEAIVALGERDLILTRLGVGLGEGTLGATGRVRSVFEGPTLEVEITGQLPFISLLLMPGALRVEGQLTGSIRDPQFQGVARLEGGGVSDLGMTLSADREGIRGAGLRFLKVSRELSGGFHLQWKDLSYAAEIRGRGLDLDLFTLPGLGRLPVTGTVTLEALAAGRGLTAAGVKGQATFQVTALRRRDRPESAGRAEGYVRAHGGRVSLERLQVDLPPNRLMMKGSLWEELNIEVSGRIPRVDLVGHLLGARDLGGKGEVAGHVTGPLETPTFRGTLTWDAPRLLGMDLHRIRGAVIVAGRTLYAPHLVVTKEKSTGIIRLRLTLPEEEKALDLEQDLRIEAEGQVTGAPQDFFSLFVRGGIPFAGQLALSGSVAGVPARLEGRGHVLVKDAVLWGEPWEVVEADLKLEPDRLRVEEVRLARGTEQVTGSGLLRFGELGTSFRLAAARLSLERFHLFAGTGLQGRMQLEAHGEGRIDNPTIRGGYHLTALRYGTIPLGGGRGRFRLQDREMTAGLVLSQQGSSVSGRLRAISPYPYDVQVTMKEAELAPLFALTGSALLQGGTGTGSGTARVGGDLAPHRLTTLALELDAPSFRIRGHTFRTAEPVRIDMGGDTLTISSLAVTGKTGWLNAGGRVAFGGAVDLGVQGKVPLAVVLHQPGLITGTAGTGELDVKTSGLWRAPRYTGWLKVADGGFRVFDHPEAFQGIGGQVNFQGHKIDIPALRASWAEGKVNVSGTALQRQGKGWRWVFDLLLDEASGERVFAWSEKVKGSVTGRTSLWGEVTAEGSRWEELQQSLGGKLKLALAQGKIRRFTVLANILRILNLTLDPVKGVPYDYLKASVRLKQRVLETQDLRFVSDTIKVGGVGNIDLGRREIHMLLAVQPLRTVDKMINALKLSKIPLLGTLLFGKERSVLVVAVKVEGPLGEPEVSPVPEESLGRGIFGIFRRLVELPAELSPAPKSGSSK